MLHLKKRRIILLAIASVTLFCFALLPRTKADWTEHSCWQHHQSIDDTIMMGSKVKTAGHVIFNDQEPVGYTDYGIWVYGKLFGTCYSSVLVHINVQVKYHYRLYSRYTGWIEHDQWNRPPSNLILWSGDYSYGASTPASYTWSATISGQTDNFGMSLGVSFTGSPFPEYASYNLDQGSWRYLGFLKSHYPTAPFAHQEFTALLRLHVNNEMANDYYNGIFSMNGIYMQWTYIKEFRFQIDFEYRGGLYQVILDIHSHLMGDGKDYYGNPSCEDLSSIPLVPGSTS